MSTHTPSPLEQERRRYRRARERRSVLLALASTLGFAALVWLTVVRTPGWAAVQDSFFNPVVAFATLPKIWDGFLLNLQVLGYSVLTVAAVAVLIATVRTLPGPVFFPLRVLAAAYTDLLRGIPFIIVLYLVGYALPTVTDTRIPLVTLGVLAVTLTYSAYVAEVIRAGIDAVHPSQRLAARALGLGYGQTLGRIVLPQALRKMTPPLMNDFISMQKDVGLISILGAVDAIAGARSAASLTYNFTPYVVAGILFVLLAIPTIRLADWYTAKLRRREQAGAIL